MEKPPVTPELPTVVTTSDPPTAGPSPDRRKPYSKPVLRSLGKVRRVTNVTLSADGQLRHKHHG